MEQCLAGDTRAQQAFVDAYAALVWSACRRAGLPEPEAEDVSQDVFTAAFAALPRFRGECRLSTWLYTMTQRRIVDYRRSPQRRQVPAGGPEEPGFPEGPPTAAEAETPETAAAESQRRARVHRAVEAMEEPTRSILLAYYLAETPVLEIARMLGLPEGTVKTRLHRGRAALRGALADLC